MSCQFSGSFLLHSLKRPLLQNLKYGCISQCVSHCLYHGRACRSFKFILLKTPYATMENCEINPRNKLNCCQVIWSMGKPYHARSGMPLLRMNTSSHINFTRHSCRLYSIDGSRRTDVSGDIDKSNLISGWAVRLANENGFLSWCRNTYLASVLAVALLEEGKMATAELAADGIFAIAGMNLFWGTATFIYNIWTLRHHINMSAVTCMTNTVGALVHLGIWVIAITMYLGYTEDENDDNGEEGELEDA